MSNAINANDFINAFSFYHAQESGVFNEKPFSAFDAGVFGSALTDVTDTTVKYMSGEIDKEKAKTEIDRAVCATVKSFVRNAISHGVDVLAIAISMKVPAIAPVVMAVKEYVKKPVLEAAEIAAEVTYEKVKAGLKKVKEFLFG